MDKTVQYIWGFIAGNNILSAFFLMLEALLLKVLLISFYFSLLYVGIWCVKKVLHKWMSISANYYCWYALPLSIALANLEINNYFKASFYQALFGFTPYLHYTYLAGCLLGAAWLVRIACKLTSHIHLNRTMQKSLKHMEYYDDNEHLAGRAIKTIGLRGEVAILIADFIDSPVSYGIIKKVILLPWHYQYKYSSDELYLLFLHEAAHIKNGDTVKLRLISLAECFIWPTSVIRLFRKQFRRDTEILCDNRVMGAQSSERDIYGDLLLKECSDRTAAMGFGFSDSYHALEYRLDALYRYRPEKQRYTAIAAVIVVALLFLSSVTYYVRADQLTIIGGNNYEFQILMSNTDFTNFEVVGQDFHDGIYEITDGRICIDKLELGKLADNYANKGYERISISWDNYALRTNYYSLSSASSFYFRFDELANTDESNRFSIERLNSRHPAEYLFLHIASKL